MQLLFCAAGIGACCLAAASVQAEDAPFLVGADISWAQEQEDQGTHFSDAKGQRDLLAILKDHKFTAVRLRIFHTPGSEKGYSKKGYCDLDHTLKMAKRIKEAGMSFLLDFHYSDTWADPGHQVKPAAWKELRGSDLEKAVHDYTRDVLLALKRQDTPPQMVQIGNEISNGFLWPEGKVWETKDWAAFCRLLEAGASAARQTVPGVKIMLHLAWGGQNGETRAFLECVRKEGLEFDVLAQSYYPKWHGTLDDLKANLTDLAERYPYKIMVAEYAMPHLREINDITRGLPRDKGAGTFFWEPTRDGPDGAALFQPNGQAKPELELYPKFVREPAHEDTSQRGNTPQETHNSPLELLTSSS